ncbi:kunitz type trypsin inhibitor 104-like [Medicago truncatula]|uniref:Kunitz type trypsin inhibitor n=1 Tax=Medicago truncatula TaxID=3880 RepID=A0A072TRF1_MEDTR|nr:kunitz type trypsin inhibitor 104-like [Medicago truncatula]KEH16150.1 Kunitz type trypsin inhibitor [Medicago truncatula]
MSTRSLTIFILAHVWLLMAKTSISQFVIDTSGEPVEDDEEYFIRPAIGGNGGGSTLVTGNGPCPLHVGLDNSEGTLGVAVKFTPFAPHHDDDNVRLNRDLRVTFLTSTSCGQSTDWRLGEKDATSGRRLIVTGRDNSAGSQQGNFFRIVQTQTSGNYNIQWCPTEVCPNCKNQCGTVGLIRENGKILLALDGGALPVVFQKE